MGKKDGFLIYKRQEPEKRAPKERVADHKEIYKAFSEKNIQKQASRCMDCGVPFCHQGCPLGNFIPDFNEAVYQAEWKRAVDLLLQTNNFPEFTGRICPAPCESSCVLSINNDPVTIELVEKSIIEKAFKEGWINPEMPDTRTGKKVAVIGSGPAGLAAAAQLNKAGHLVDIYEKDDRPGGLLRYGIPDFKLEKWVIDRRIALMEQEGIRFYCNRPIGTDLSLKKLRKNYDAVLLCIGALKPRELPIPNSDAEGVHFAMDYLVQHNRFVSDNLNDETRLDAYEKDVIVIGGGDTGSDCVGTANRQKAKSISQFQYRPAPPSKRSHNNPWPEWPLVLSESTSHEEGCERVWGWLTKEFITDKNNRVTGLKVVELEWKNAQEYVEKSDSVKIFPCNLALIAIGYQGPEIEALKTKFDLDNRGNVKIEDWQTSMKGVFSAGDSSRGQSLVVNAISDGREAARAIDIHLMGSSTLPSKEASYIDLNDNL